MSRVNCRPVTFHLLSATADCSTLDCGSASFKLRLLAADDFPDVQPIEGATVTLPVSEFSETIEQVARSASRDETRPHLTGILLSIEDDKLRSVATDSYRLAVRTTKIDPPVTQKIEANVPARALQEATRIADGHDTIEITLAERQIAFSAGDTLLVSRLIDGQFPDFEQLLPDSYEHVLDVDVSELHDAVKRVSLLAQRNTPLKVALSEGELEVSAQTTDIGEGRETLPGTGLLRRRARDRFQPGLPARRSRQCAHRTREVQADQRVPPRPDRRRRGRGVHVPRHADPPEHLSQRRPVAGVIVRTLNARNFRSYERAQVELGERVTVVTGDNGAGKTNLLEALFFGCVGRSCRTRIDAQAVRFDQPVARVEVEGYECRRRSHARGGDRPQGRQDLLRRRRARSTRSSHSSGARRPPSSCPTASS